MSKPTFRRFLAYIIDILVIGLIVGAFSSIKFLNPKVDEYTNLQKEYNSYITELSMTNPQALMTDERALTMKYDISYIGVYSSIISLVVTFLYFGIFQFYTNGRTVGKLCLGIEVISTDKDKLRLSQTIIRSGIINSLLTSSLLIIAVLFLSRTAYDKASLVIELLDLALVFTSIGMVIYRQDGVGLHDKLANTRVVLKSERDELIKEAEYVEKEAKVIEEKPKKVTKRKPTKRKTIKKEDE